MAMSESSLSNRIMTKLVAAGFNETEQNRVLTDAIAAAVIEEIIANMVTTTVVASGSSAGTYTGKSV
jgi:hypothetical protein